jgi:arginine-tRNA-protein transferase
VLDVSSHASRQASVRLYSSDEQPCSYLSDRRARLVFVDPLAAMDGRRYQWLLEEGFRRSGSLVYRPGCHACEACMPVRLPVHQFVPDRSQRRARQRNRNLQVRFLGAAFDEEHFALYRKYLASRHPDGEMAADGDDLSYQRFLIDPWGGETELMELRLDGRLIAVAVTDVLPDGLSAAYTFFDPAERARSLGTYAILRQIEEAQRRRLAHLYLGFWIEPCRKMRYKDRFRPLQVRLGRRWVQCERGDPIPAVPERADRQPGQEQTELGVGRGGSR